MPIVGGSHEWTIAVAYALFTALFPIAVVAALLGTVFIMLIRKVK